MAVPARAVEDEAVSSPSIRSRLVGAGGETRTAARGGPVEGDRSVRSPRLLPHSNFALAPSNAHEVEVVHAGAWEL